jgi:hypothetical protein
MRAAEEKIILFVRWFLLSEFRATHKWSLPPMRNGLRKKKSELRVFDLDRDILYLYFDQMKRLEPVATN